VPRPMSWEGELSDHERDMCVDDDSGSQLMPPEETMPETFGSVGVS
jgi:hypothetical protein